MTMRVEGSGDNYDKDILKKKNISAEKNAQNNKPTSAQINEAMKNSNSDKKVTNSDKNLDVKGFYVEQNPDDNTFVDFNDGATKNIRKNNKDTEEIEIKTAKDVLPEGFKLSKEAIEQMKKEFKELSPDKLTTMALGEEGGAKYTTQAIGEEGGDTLVTLVGGESGDTTETTKTIGEEGGTSVTLAGGESGDISETTKPAGEEGATLITQAGFEGGEPGTPKIDDETKEKIQDFIDALKNRKLSTQALGEEGGDSATTKAVGEEGGSHYTTMALGEEGGSSADITTKAVGEEGGGSADITTKAMGEEGGSSVTYALGENGDAIELDDETKKKIQEIFDKYIKNAKLSTQAIGEEGGGPIKIEGKTKEEIQKMFDEYIKEHRLTTIATSEEGGSDILDPKKGLL